MSWLTSGARWLGKNVLGGNNPPIGSEQFSPQEYQPAAIPGVPTAPPGGMSGGMPGIPQLGANLMAFGQPASGGFDPIGKPSIMGVPGATVAAAAGDAGSWLGKDDNWAKILGAGLGAYGAYSQGKTADKQLQAQRDQLKVENDRYNDDRNRHSQAAAEVSPQIKLMMEQLQKHIAAQAAGGA